MPLKNSSRNGNRPLLWQVLIVAITLTAVVVAILLGRQAYNDTREMATEQFNRQQLLLARSAATGTEAYYQELGEALSSLAQLPSIQQMATDETETVRVGDETLDKELEELRAQGMSGWLLKPPSLEQLAKVVARALEE
jgi:hypothetical protein